MTNKSFTLIEIIVAIFLLTVGALGIFALIQRTLAFTSISSSRLQATYLAQEGMEIARNIRDTNWLEGSLWDDGLSQGNWEVDYQTLDLNRPYVGNFLNIDGNGFYGYSLGNQTKFKRKITVTPEGIGILEILAEVSWQERGRAHQVTSETKLYNWR